MISYCYGNSFVWLTADVGSGAHSMESQHLIVTGSNHDITWYKVTGTDEQAVQVTSVCSLTAAHVSSVSIKGDYCHGSNTTFIIEYYTGGKINAISLYTSQQGDVVLVLINGHILCHLNINMSHNQFDITICCDLSMDMGFMEAILGIRFSKQFYKLIYRHPLLLAVTSDSSTLGILFITHDMLIL